MTLCMLSVCWWLAHSFATLWPTSWSNNIHTLYKNSSSTFCIELLHLCNLWPIQPPCLHTCTMQHINYISANLWATGWSKSIIHYVRTQEVHPVMTSFTSANCGSYSHSANILYIHYEAHPLYLCKAVACQLV